jgi:YqaJ-like viral recombinase domain
MKIVECAQGSTEWFLARCGVLTASEVDALITPAGKIKAGAAVETYLYEKLAEKVMGFPEVTAASWAMDQGKILETMALPWLEFDRGVKVRRVGFCVSDDGRIGCSPDGLIGEDCGVEIKSPQPAQHVRYLLEGVVPEKYVPQIQMSMHVTGRPHWWFVSYSKDMPCLLVDVPRDPVFQASLKKALDGFLDEFDQKLAHLRKLIDL